jgi:two-component system, NarL family, nitrate/nitrite response regulator NarL
MKRKTKILVADDHKVVRDGYVSLLNENDSFEVTDVAGNGQEAIDILSKKQADILILDIEMPVLDGIKALPVIKQKHPDIKVLMISMHGEKELIADCAKKGADGFLNKSFAKEEFFKALDTLRKKGFYFDGDVSGLLISEFLEKDGHKQKTKKPLFSERERAVLKLLCEEKSSKEIARELNISENTVEYHRKNIFKKTNSRSVLGLYKFAIANRICT